MRQPFAPAHFPAGASPAGVPSAASLGSMVAESFEGARRKSQAPAPRAARTRSTVRPEGPIEGARRPASKRDGGAGLAARSGGGVSVPMASFYPTPPSEPPEASASGMNGGGDALS